MNDTALGLVHLVRHVLVQLVQLGPQRRNALVDPALHAGLHDLELGAWLGARLRPATVWGGPASAMSLWQMASTCAAVSKAPGVGC